ncbi:MAG: HAMP domain-containing histidine kinase, partial [Rhodospirillales bacterium]|nr:HAMP domain-containing histidine kinase [Rhodospirillales bacterium]
MTQSSPQARHLVSAAMLFSVPTVSTLVILMALGSLEIAPGLTAMAVSVALTVLFVRSLAADISRLDAYVRALPWGNPSVPYLDRPELTAELAYGLGHLRRNLRQDRTELAERLASAERVVDGIPDPLLLLDPQRRVVRDNRAARLLFGKEAANRDLAALLRVPALLEAVERAFVHGGPEEVEFVLPVPVERDLRARIEHLTIPGADGTVAVLTLQDISALKRIQKMRVDFVANASHELRTPLASLIGFIDTLRGPARDDAEARERFLNIMYDQATRMSRLVDDLLSLSRIELHEYTQPLNRVALAPLLERVAETLQVQVTRRGMAIDIDAAPGLPEVMGQPDELFQVFLNLFDNAVKYGREGSVV